jgi:membrane-bound lytic murein transglycosylase D
VSPDEFLALNPQMNKPVILAAGTPQLLLPYDNANRFLREVKRHRGPLASWTAWVAPTTMKPAAAAKAVGIPEAQLRDVNRIPARMLVKAGSTLLVPRSASATHDVAEQVADNAMLALAPEPRPRAVRKGARSVKAGAARPQAAAATRVAKAAPASATRAAPRAKAPARPAARPTRVAQAGTPTRR